MKQWISCTQSVQLVEYMTYVQGIMGLDPAGGTFFPL